MQTVLVMRQLSSVLDGFMAEVTRKVRLTPQDVLILAWIVEKPGIPGCDIALFLGRKPQNVHRSLQRLEDRFIAERYGSASGSTVGWGLTEHGRKIWAQIEDGFLRQDLKLVARGIVTRPFLDGLKNMMNELMRIPEGPNLGLVQPPVPRPTPKWDF
jgi:DNA-binding MarR family transcriptional regulator